MTTELTPPGMGRCEITGRVVPEDELVVISGQRVCAEGKVILLERLKAGEAAPGEAERPTVIRRFGCIFLDGLILAVPAFGINFAIIGAGVAGATAGSSTLMLVAVGQIVALAINVAYFTLMHGSGGKTIGKMAGKLRVVRLDNQPMDMKTAFIRAMAYQGLGIIPAILIMVSPVLATIGNVAVGVYGLANVIVALVDSHQQRAIHDRIAGTRVIMPRG